MRLKDWLPSVVVVLIVAVGIVWYNQKDEGDSSRTTQKSERPHACQALSGELAARVDACLTELPRAEISEAARLVIEDLAKSGKIFSIGNFDTTVSTLKLEDNPPIKEAL